MKVIKNKKETNQKVLTNIRSFAFIAGAGLVVMSLMQMGDYYAIGVCCLLVACIISLIIDFKK